MSKEINSQSLNTPAENIVFFDGYCVLCNGFVDFLLKADKKQVLLFASLQGETAKTALPPSYLKQVDTVIFKGRQNVISVKSNAVINIMISLGGAWEMAKFLKFIPRFLRDSLYDFIANKRFGWFGKRNSCRIPTESEKDRILP